MLQQACKRVSLMSRIGLLEIEVAKPTGTGSRDYLSITLTHSLIAPIQDGELSRVDATIFLIISTLRSRLKVFIVGIRNDTLPASCGVDWCAILDKILKHLKVMVADGEEQ